MNQISAVIFDFDGLLVDSEPVQMRAWDQYLELLGLRTTPDLLNNMYGRRLIDASAAVVGHFDLDISPQTVATERDEIFLALVSGAIQPKPGALRLLTALSGRNVPLALATSGHRRYLDLASASAEIDQLLFDAVITGDLVEHGKPHPETFLIAARALDVEPARCLVLEDSPNGVRAALSAGMACIAIPDSPDHRSELVDAHYILDSLDDVLPVIEGQLRIAKHESGAGNDNLTS